MSDKANDKTKLVKKEIDDVTKIMLKNVESMVERGDRIENLVEKTDDLARESSRFKRSARQLKNKMCTRNYKLAAIIATIVLIIIGLIILTIYTKMNN